MRTFYSSDPGRRGKGEAEKAEKDVKEPLKLSPREKRQGKEKEIRVRKR